MKTWVVFIFLFGLVGCDKVSKGLRQGADVMEGAADVVEFIDDSGLYDLDGISEIIDESADVLDSVADYIDAKNE
jgi:hypothetical protein